MCNSFRIAVVSVICAVIASGHVHGPRRSRVTNIEDYAQNEVDSGRADESSWWPTAEFSVLQKVYDDCSEKKQFSMCLKGKAFTALTRAVEMESVQLADGLTLVKQADAPSAISEPRFFSGMTPEDKLDTMLRSKFEQLMNTHTISMDLASEGRGRGKKVLPYLLLGIFTTVSIVGGMALKTLAAIAGKALIASKVALTIAGIIALKKLFSHDGSQGETTFQVHADGHHRRNLYVVRQAKPGAMDPYRYYTEQTTASA
ncbi:osiris 21 [Aphomia sociella]